MGATQVGPADPTWQNRNASVETAIQASAHDVELEDGEPLQQIRVRLEDQMNHLHCESRCQKHDNKCVFANQS